jgi:glycosyltransferase involved in cell wall biosynthesis
MKIAVITPVSRTGETGGAELLYQGLIEGLRQNGTRVDQVRAISDESSFRAIRRSYLTFYDLDVSAYDGVISTKAPSYLVRHTNHVCYLLHTMRSYYDMFPYEFEREHRSLERERRFLHSLDKGALSFPRTRNVFVIGQEVAERLETWNGLRGRVLRPALPPGRYRNGASRYLLVPSRLHRWKRIDLTILALRHVAAGIRVKITGSGEDERFFRELARKDRRIEFLGWVSRRRLLRLYADALAVVFVPRQEDFGFVTLEAFASGKPVITCSDSGEPARLVRDGINGRVCRPDPLDLAGAIQDLAEDPDKARSLGEAARAGADFSSWRQVGGRLLSALQEDA